MKSVWLTYSWDDNQDGDIDFVAQELIRAGIEVKLDRWNLQAGKRLWEQIDSFIQDSSKTDAWLFYATQNSLGSQKCREEFSYALNRALDKRGDDFPVIALFPAPIEVNLIPSGIKTRLYVSLTDPEWKERVLASIEKRKLEITKNEVQPYAFTVHMRCQKEDYPYVIELRPRGGTWSPFFVAIPSNEKASVSPFLGFGPANRIPVNIMLQFCGNGLSDDGNFWHYYAQNEATPTQSYYLYCKKLPTTLIFGIQNGAPQYRVSLNPN